MAETQKMSALKSLANQLPVANQRIASQQQAARDMQLQQAAAAIPASPSMPTPKIAPTAQTTGAAVAQQAGQQQVAGAQQAGQQLGQVAEAALGEQKLANQAQVAGQQAGLREQQISNVERFAKLNSQLKSEIYDNELQFKKDQVGRTLFTERQLQDYMAKNARSEEELKNYAQSAQQISDRKIQILDASYNKVVRQLDLEFKKAQQAKNQQATLEIKQMKDEAAKARQRAITKEKNKAAQWGAGGTVVGAVAGAFIGDPVTGAAIGSQAGGAVGTMAAST